jgi:polysaccharide deacetylase family protein (PEP-CTERM system associated)
VTQPSILNALTIDVEEYFHARRLSRDICFSDWDLLPAQIPQTMEILLETLNQHKVQVTFFVLGWLAKKYPALIRSLSRYGHEIASHGYYHQAIDQLSQEAFYQDLKHSKECLEDCIGVPVRGYRAPNFSLNQKTPWAWEILAKAGYTYSSSVYPIYHDHYGWPDGPRFIMRTPALPVIEIPISTLRFGKVPLPCGGGGYFRLLPYTYSAKAIRSLNQKEKKPVIFYFHPWELSSKLPNIGSASWVDRRLTTLNQGKMHQKLQALLQEFRWGTVFDVLKESLYYPYAYSST